MGIGNLVERISRKLSNRKTRPNLEEDEGVTEGIEENKICYNLSTLTFQEQLGLIHTLEQYMSNIESMIPNPSPELTRGYALLPEVYVSGHSGSQVSRVQMDVFYQNSLTGERQAGYRASLIRFSPDESWFVYHFKEVVSSDSYVL